MTMIAEIEAEVMQLEASIADWDRRFADLSDRLRQAWSELANAASDSWIGYHATVYYRDFIMPPAGAEFDSFSGYSVPENGWREYNYQEFLDELVRRAGTSVADLDPLAAIAGDVTRVLLAAREEIVSSLDALLAMGPDRRLEELRGRLADVRPVIPQNVIIQERRPSQVRSADMRALNGGVRTPLHVLFQSWHMEATIRVDRAREVVTLARAAISYLRKKDATIASAALRPQGTKVFIGHGHSAVWFELKDFLQTKLGLEVVDFNSVSPAGVPTQERLAELVDASRFAFLVMTAEDEHADATKHARENVVHEVGLFQGRLGFRKAIVMIEESCAEFSNIHGLGQIRFPRGKIKAAFEEVRDVLERESII